MRFQVTLSLTHRSLSEAAHSSTADFTSANRLKQEDSQALDAVELDIEKVGIWIDPIGEKYICMF